MPIILVRHAESEANAMGRVHSVWDTKLSEKGKEQAKALSGILPSCDVVISSPFVRAIDTAELAGFPSPRIWLVQEFTFISKSHGRLAPDSLSHDYWESAVPDYCDGEDTESFCEFLERVRTVLWQLQPENAAIVFTHSLFIKAVYWIILGGGFDMKAFHSFKQWMDIPNTAFTTLTFSGTQWSITGVNTAHLQAAEK
jgi:broad specificity phosphatase PhoE